MGVVIRVADLMLGDRLDLQDHPLFPLTDEGDRMVAECELYTVTGLDPERGGAIIVVSFDGLGTAYAVAPDAEIEVDAPRPTVFILDPSGEPWVGDWIENSGQTVYDTAAEAFASPMGTRWTVFEVYALTQTTTGKRGWRIVARP